MPGPAPDSPDVARGGADIDADNPTLAERRSTQILQAAVALFAERGYVDTKIDDICAAIGVGKGLIYRYFRDKQDVLFHALVAVLDKYRAENFAGRIQSEGPLAVLRRVLAVHGRLADQHALEVLLAYRTTMDLAPEQRQHIKAIETALVDEIRQCLQAAIDQGLLQAVDSRILAYQVLMYGHTWALKRWTLSRDFDIEAYVAEGERLLLQPLLTAAGRKVFASGAAQAARRPRR